MALSNAKHERFCVEYVVDHNGSRAATRAGYSEKTAAQQASRLLTDAKIRARIAELDTAVIEKVVGSAEWIVEQAVALQAEARRAGQYGPANSALALLAKRHREFSEKQDVEHAVNVTVTRNTRGLRGK